MPHEVKEDSPEESLIIAVPREQLLERPISPFQDTQPWLISNDPEEIKKGLETYGSPGLRVSLSINDLEMIERLLTMAAEPIKQKMILESKRKLAYSMPEAIKLVLSAATADTKSQILVEDLISSAIVRGRVDSARALIDEILYDDLEKLFRNCIYDKKLAIIFNILLSLYLNRRTLYQKFHTLYLLNERSYQLVQEVHQKVINQCAVFNAHKNNIENWLYTQNFLITQLFEIIIDYLPLEYYEYEEEEFIITPVNTPFSNTMSDLIPSIKSGLIIALILAAALLTLVPTLGLAPTAIAAASVGLFSGGLTFFCCKKPAQINDDVILGYAQP